MSERPDSFVVTKHGDRYAIDRHINIGREDFVSFRITNSIKGVPDPAISDLDKMSLTIVIRHLLTFLPAEHKGPAFAPGPRQESK